MTQETSEGFRSSLARILTVVTYAYQYWAIFAEKNHNQNVEIKDKIEAFWHPERE